MNITIRETTDSQQLAALSEQVQQLHHELYPKIFKPFDEKAIAGFFETVFVEREAKAFLAVDGETVLGYVLLIITDLNENPFLYPRSYVTLDQLLVLEQYRGQGVAKLLLEQAIAYTREQQIDRIELNHWTMNHAARSFFNRSGFKYSRESMAMDL
jgi:GNAT superfamily N-acetyltransferase